MRKLKSIQSKPNAEIDWQDIAPQIRELATELGFEDTKVKHILREAISKVKFLNKIKGLYP